MDRATLVPRESLAAAMIRERLADGSIIRGDVSGAWDRFVAPFDIRRVHHSIEIKAEDATA
ncbi:MAG TPA: hypothetical protein VFX06_04460 [Stellaceae bacterium]|nr:hypothetical protein [Stellaceae bacterium]